MMQNEANLFRGVDLLRIDEIGSRHLSVQQRIEHVDRMPQ